MSTSRKSFFSHRLLASGFATLSLTASFTANAALRFTCTRPDLPGEVSLQITGHVLSAKEMTRIAGYKGFDTFRVEVINQGAVRDYQTQSNFIVDKILSKSNQLTRDDLKLLADSIQVANPYYYEGSGVSATMNFPIAIAPGSKGFSAAAPMRISDLSFDAVKHKEAAIEFRTENPEAEAAAALADKISKADKSDKGDKNDKASKRKKAAPAPLRSLSINLADPAKSQFFMQSYEPIGFSVGKAKAILVNCETEEFNYFRQLAEECDDAQPEAQIEAAQEYEGEAAGEESES